jgi:hypothetical protein
MLVNDSITAVLLFAQFSILRSRALLAIASGYLFTRRFCITGSVGRGAAKHGLAVHSRQSGLPVFVIGYALLKDAELPRRLWQGSVAAGIGLSVALTAVMVCIATFVVTAGDAVLPGLMLDEVSLSDRWFNAAACVAVLSALALVVLWIRGRSVLDLWLCVVMCADVIEACLISFLFRPVSRSAGMPKYRAEQIIVDLEQHGYDIVAR